MSLNKELINQGNLLFRYRSYFPLALYPLLIFFNITNQEHIYDINKLMIGLLISYFGELIRIMTIAFVPPNTSGRNTKKQTANSLNTTGIYSLVRHPLYLGNYFILLGPFIIFPQISLIIIYTLLFWIYYERIMFAEEDYLKNKFKDDFSKWAHDIPAFIPKLSNYVKPNGSFSFSRVIKREYTGLCGIIFMFFFIMLSFGFFREMEIPQDHILTYGLLINTIIYIILRTYKKISKKNN